MHTAAPRLCLEKQKAARCAEAAPLVTKVIIVIIVIIVTRSNIFRSLQGYLQRLFARRSRSAALSDLKICPGEYQDRPEMKGMYINQGKNEKPPSGCLSMSLFWALKLLKS